MRIVSNRCDMFEYTITGASPCAVELGSASVGRRRSFMDCLVLDVGVEPGDLAMTRTAADVVHEIALLSEAGDIVINVHSHRERQPRCGSRAKFDPLVELADTLDVLSGLTDRLTDWATGTAVHPIPFGWKIVRHANLQAGPWSRRVTRLGPPPPVRSRRRGPRVPAVGRCRMPSC